MKRVLGLWLLAAIIVSMGCAKKAPAADETSLRALDAAYVDAWLTAEGADQEEKVLALFARDAIIMPGGGLPPEEGIARLKEFWFPDGAAATTVTHFTHEIGDIDISGPLGFVSGRYTLSFLSDGQPVTQTGSYLIVAEDDGGKWRIKNMIWNDQSLTEV